MIVVGDEALLFTKPPRREATFGAGNSGWVLFNLEEPLDFPDDLFSRRPRLCRRVEVNERQVSGAERGAPSGDNGVVC